MRSESLKRVSVLMGTVFVDMVGFSMVFSQLPFYAKKFGATPVVIGFLTAAWAVGKLISSPLWGRFSDQRGRRPAILSGLCLSAVAFLLYGLASANPVVALAHRLQGEASSCATASLIILFVSRLFQGFGGGTAGVVQAYVSDSCAPEDRSKVLGWVTAATSAGVMIGPALGSLTVTLGPAMPGLLAAGFCLLNIAGAWAWLPEPPGRREGAPKERMSSRRTAMKILTQPFAPVSLLVLTYAFGMLFFMSSSGVLALYLEFRFGVKADNIGWFFTYVATITLIMRAVLLGPTIRRFGEVKTLRLGALAIALGLLTIPLAYNWPTLALTAAFLPIGTALLFPVTTSLTSQYFRREETGQALGLQQAFGDVARISGPILATAAFQQLGERSPYWIAGSLMLLVCVFTLRIEPPPPAITAAEPQPAT